MGLKVQSIEALKEDFNKSKYLNKMAVDVLRHLTHNAQAAITNTYKATEAITPSPDGKNRDCSFINGWVNISRVISEEANKYQQAVVILSSAPDDVRREAEAQEMQGNAPWRNIVESKALFYDNLSPDDYEKYVYKRSSNGNS